MNHPKAIIYPLVLVITLAVCLLAGCIGDNGGSGEKGLPELEVLITSPSSGNIISGKERVEFGCQATGGKEPYSYSWSTPFGQLSTKKSFSKSPSELKKGDQVVVAKVFDAAGNEKQASITITVL